MISLEFGDSKIDFVMSGAEDTEFYQDLVSRFDLKNSVYYLGHSSSSEIPVYAMEASAFRNFAKQFGVNDQDMRQAVLLNDRSFNLREDGSYVVERLTDLQPGDTYKANIIPETPTKCVSNSSIEDESGISWVVDVDDACVKAEGAEPYNVDLQVTKIIDQYPFGFESYHSPMILVSTASDRLADLGFAHDFTSEFFASEVDDVDAITTYLDEYFEAHPTDQPYYYQNVKESISQMRRIYLLISIFLWFHHCRYLDWRYQHLQHHHYQHRAARQRICYVEVYRYDQSRIQPYGSPRKFNVFLQGARYRYSAWSPYLVRILSVDR